MYISAVSVNNKDCAPTFKGYLHGNLVNYIDNLAQHDIQKLYRRQQEVDSKFLSKDVIIGRVEKLRNSVVEKLNKYLASLDADTTLTIEENTIFLRDTKRQTKLFFKPNPKKDKVNSGCIRGNNIDITDPIALNQQKSDDIGLLYFDDFAELLKQKVKPRIINAKLKKLKVLEDYKLNHSGAVNQLNVSKLEA